MLDATCDAIVVKNRVAFPREASPRLKKKLAANRPSARRERATVLANVDLPVPAMPLSQKILLQIELEEVVESWDKYDRKATPNVFYPICLEGVLNERYLVSIKSARGRIFHCSFVLRSVFIGYIQACLRHVELHDKLL
jgi:hypothetical protein